MTKIETSENGIRIERATLDNGLRVLLLERPGLPMLSFHLLVESGTIAEKGIGESGLAQLTTQLLSQGTEHYSAVELALAVENLGASLGAHSDRDFTTIGLSSLARDRGVAMNLLAEVVQRPAFATDEVERKRQEILTVLQRNQDDAGFQVSRLLAKRLYSPHPYSHAVLGESAVLESLNRDDLIRFYQSHFVPKNSVLAVVGEFDAKVLLDEIRSEFGKWSSDSSDSSDVSTLPLPPSDEPLSGAHETHQQDGVTQATVRVGCRTIPRNHPDYIPLVVLDHVLGGGGFSSRLMKSLRDEMGWTYGASSSLQLQRHGGAWLAGFKTAQETLDPAIERLFVEIQKLGEDGPTEDEIEQARSYLTGSLPLTFETNAQWASYALEAELYGLPAFFWEDEAARLRSLQRSELVEVGRKYLVPDRFAVAVHGDFRETEKPAAES